MSARPSLILALIAAAAALPASAGARGLPLATVTDPAAAVAHPGATRVNPGHPSAPASAGQTQVRRPSTDRRLTPTSARAAPGAALRPLAGPAPALLPIPSLVRSFDGIDHRDQVLANGGSDFASAEPPDQGLCVGHGHVTEAVNDAVRFYTTTGAPLGPPRDLNSFFGYAPEISSSGVIGPFITDPSCLFDPTTQRWFLTVLTAEVDPVSGAFLGPNHVDIAVSRTSDPTKSWAIYRLAVQDDGTQGTPNHHCTAAGPGTGDGPCLGDYPHIGADAAGFYVTTNEYSLGGPDFHGAQVYALSKDALVAAAPSVPIVQFDTHGLDNGNSGFTIWPATSPGDGPGAAGTEYLMSSNAADEAHGDGTAGGPRASHQLLVWALTNTRSLGAATPRLALTHTVLTVAPYSLPPLSDQKPGPVPLADCLNDTACATLLNGEPDPFAPEAEAALDSNDTRMQQVSFAAGRLWGALDTALPSGGQARAGIEWFVVRPAPTAGAASATLENQGYTGLTGENLTYPAIGVTSDGTGVMAFTVVGPDHYPSAGYAAISATGVGPVELAQRGAGPSDGLSDYKYYGQPPGTASVRWGDYGAAAVDGTSVWIASEYIGQTCDLAVYESSNGTCGDTRTPLANWDTRISQLTTPAPRR